MYVLYFNENVALVQLCDVLRQQYSIKINSLSEQACITYNKQRTEIVDWGNDSIKSKPIQGNIQVDEFMAGLYHIFKKDKNNTFLKKAVSDFLSLITKKLMECPEMKNKSLDTLHYAIIVPSEWEEEIREELIRPIFVEANLISSEDYEDRLLFISDVESICYNWAPSFKRDQNTVLCRLAPIESNNASIKLDLIKTTNTVFEFSNSMFFPKVMNSNSMSITSAEIKQCIKAFIKDKIFLNNKNNDPKNVIEDISEAVYSSVDRWTVIKAKNSWPSSINRLFLKNDEEDDGIMIKKPLFRDTSKWNLTDKQRDILKSICPSDICPVIGKKLFEKVRDITSGLLVKKYEFMIVQDWYTSKIDLNLSLEIWLKYIFMHNAQDFHKNTKNMDKANSKFHSINLNGIIYGAEKLVQEAIQNSNIHCPPRIRSSEIQAISSSIFKETKPEAMIYINISLKYTSFSFTRSDKNRKSKEISNHYFKLDEFLPALENFYNISDVVNLTMNTQFILFADKYLSKDYSDFLVNKDIIFTIEAILTRSWAPEEIVTSIRSAKYIKGFLLIYLIYIKEIVSSKLLKQNDINAMSTGYVVSIEKNLLKNIAGNRKELEELLYKSGLIDKDNEYTKLRVLVQGEGVLSRILQTFDLDFPLKSYFVLTQLHERHIQLSLNQIVTTSDLEFEQESIIIEDRTISIVDIYDTLYLSIWDSLMQGNSLFRFCDAHKNSSKEEISELFSLETQKKFMDNFKQYILDNILHNRSDLHLFSKSSYKLNNYCACSIDLTVNDVVEISFKPLLKDINSIMLTSLINDDFYGKYSNIKYHFSLIHFNQNIQFSNILTRILEEESLNFSPKRGIDTLCMVIPKFFDQSLETIPYLYDSFKRGSLCQIYNKNYAFVMFESNEFNGEKEESHYFAEQESKPAYLLLKKEDKIINTEMNHTFYFDKPNNWKFTIAIEIYEYEKFDFLEDKQVTIKKDNWKGIARFDIFLKSNEYENSKIPLIITVKTLGYSSTIQLSARLVGNVIDEYNIPEIGHPMTLCRY